jgi:hypothetical protein
MSITEFAGLRRVVNNSAGIYRQEVVELEKLSASSPAIR